MIEIDSRTEEGFQDVILTIQDEIRDGIGGVQLIAKGSYRGTIVGVRIVVKKHSHPGMVNGKFSEIAFVKEGICFESIGKESDNFVSALCELYGVGPSKPFSLKRICYTSFPMTEHNPDIFQTAVKFKMFFDENDDIGLYHEIYCNINIPKREVELPEKDVEYRDTIIRALTLHQSIAP